MIQRLLKLGSLVLMIQSEDYSSAQFIRGWRSYRSHIFLRKEVIQPQVPLRLPCYDLVPITKFAFGAALLAVGLTTSGALSFRGLTGGVYKAQEHIHRGVADPRLLAIPTSRRRVAASYLNWGEL